MTSVHLDKVDHKGKKIESRVLLEPDIAETKAIHALLQKSGIRTLEAAKQKLTYQRNIRFLEQLKNKTPNGTFDSFIVKQVAKKNLKELPEKLYETNFPDVFNHRVIAIKSLYENEFLSLFALIPTCPQSDQERLKIFLKAARDPVALSPSFTRLPVESDRAAHREWQHFVKTPKEGAALLASKVLALIDQKRRQLQTEQKQVQSQRDKKRAIERAQLMQELKQKIKAAPKKTLEAVSRAGQVAGTDCLWAAEKMIQGVAAGAVGTLKGLKWAAEPPKHAAHLFNEWARHGSEWRKSCLEAVTTRDEIIVSLKNRFGQENESLRGFLRKRYFQELVFQLKKISAPFLFPEASTGEEIKSRIRVLHEAIEQDLIEVEHQIPQYLIDFNDVLTTLESAPLVLHVEHFITRFTKGPLRALPSSEPLKHSQSLAAFTNNPVFYLKRLLRLAKILAAYADDKTREAAYRAALQVEGEDFQAVWEIHTKTRNYQGTKQVEYPSKIQLQELHQWCKRSCCALEPILTNLLQDAEHPLTLQAEGALEESLKSRPFLSKILASLSPGTQRDDAFEIYNSALRKKVGMTLEVLLNRLVQDKAPKVYISPWNAICGRGPFREPWIDPRMDDYLRLPSRPTLNDLLREADKFPRELESLVSFITETLTHPPEGWSRAEITFQDGGRPEWLGMTESDIQARQTHIANAFKQIDARIDSMKTQALCAYSHPLIQELIRARFIYIEHESEQSPAKAYLQAVWLFNNLQSEAEKAYFAFLELIEKNEESQVKAWEAAISGERNEAKANWDTPPLLPSLTLPEIDRYKEKLQTARWSSPQITVERVLTDFVKTAERLRGKRKTSARPISLLPIWRKIADHTKEQRDQTVDAFLAFHRLVVQESTLLEENQSPVENIVRIKSSAAFEHFHALYQKWPQKLDSFVNTSELKEALAENGKRETNCPVCFEVFEQKVYRAPVPSKGLFFIEFRDADILKNLEQHMSLHKTGFFLWPDEPLIRLTCGHGVCRDCLTKHYRVNVEEPMKKLRSKTVEDSDSVCGKFSCPECRKPIPFDILDPKKYASFFPFIKNLSQLRVNHIPQKKAGAAYLQYMPCLLEAIGFHEIVSYGHFTFFTDKEIELTPDPQTAAKLRKQAKLAIASLRLLEDDPLALMEAGRIKIIDQLRSYLVFVGKRHIQSYRNDLLYDAGWIISTPRRLALIDQATESFAAKLAELYQSTFQTLAQTEEFEIAAVLDHLRTSSKALAKYEQEATKQRLTQLVANKVNFEDEIKQVEESIQAETSKILPWLKKGLANPDAFNRLWDRFTATLLSSARIELAGRAKGSGNITLVAVKAVQKKYTGAHLWDLIAKEFPKENLIQVKINHLANEITLLLSQKQLPQPTKKKLLQEVEQAQREKNDFFPALKNLIHIHLTLLIEESDLQIETLKTEKDTRILFPTVVFEHSFAKAFQAARNFILSQKQFLLAKIDINVFERLVFLAEDIALLKHIDTLMQESIDLFVQMRNFQASSVTQRLKLEIKMIHSLNNMASSLRLCEAQTHAFAFKETLDQILSLPRNTTYATFAQLIESIAHQDKDQAFSSLYSLISLMEASNAPGTAKALARMHDLPHLSYEEKCLVDQASRTFLSTSVDTFLTYGPSLMPLEPLVHPGFRNLGNTCYLNTLLILLGQREIIGHLAKQTTPLAKAFYRALLARTFGCFMEDTFNKLMISMSNFFHNKSLDPFFQQDPMEVLDSIAEELGLHAPESPLLLTTSWNIQYADKTDTRTEKGFLLRANDLKHDIAATIKSSLLGEGKGNEAISYQQIAETGTFLLVQLVRWRPLEVNGEIQFRKDSTPIAVNPVLDLSQFKGVTTDSYTGKRYALAAVIEHRGDSPHAGHYVAQDSGLLINDDLEPRAPTAPLKPYLVLYRKI